MSDLSDFGIGAVEGGASRVIEVLKNRAVSKDCPIRQEIDFGGSTGSVTVALLGRGPSAATLTVRIIADAVYERSFGTIFSSQAGHYFVGPPQAFPILPKGKLIVEVHSSSPADWAISRVVLRYMNGMSYTIAGETPAPPPEAAPCTCAVLLLIITSILGLLMQVF